MPQAPDQRPPLDFFMEIAVFVGPTVPVLGMLLLGAALSRLSMSGLPTGFWKAAVMMAGLKLVVGGFLFLFFCHFFFLPGSREGTVRVEFSPVLLRQPGENVISSLCGYIHAVKLRDLHPRYSQRVCISYIYHPHTSSTFHGPLSKKYICPDPCPCRTDHWHRLDHRPHQGNHLDPRNRQDPAVGDDYR